MTLAAQTREAVREHPFLLEALRAGVVNYRAAADFLNVGDGETVAAALRRYREDLPDRETAARDARVTVERGVGVGGRGGTGFEDDEGALSVDGTRLEPDAGSLTAVRATGEVDGAVLAAVLDRLAVVGVTVEAAGVLDGTLVVAVGGRDGAAALRVVERTLEEIPDPP